ncbi:MAG: oxidoreductase, partial [Elusimicrobiota bacterium]
MSHARQKPDAPELKRALSLLQAMVEDRTLLAQLPLKERVAFMMAAGRVSRPERDEQRKMARTLRLQRKRARKTSDRAIRAGTQIRAARREA